MEINFFKIPCCFFYNSSEPLEGIELTTSSLPRKCSTTELQRRSSVGSYQLAISSNSLITANRNYRLQTENERKTGLEPATYSLEGYRSTKWATSAYEFTSSKIHEFTSWNQLANPQTGKLFKERGQEWIRTTEVVRQRIYSPPHLAALEPARLNSKR